MNLSHGLVISYQFWFLARGHTNYDKAHIKVVGYVSVKYYFWVVLCTAQTIEGLDYMEQITSSTIKHLFILFCKRYIGIFQRHCLVYKYIWVTSSKIISNLGCATRKREKQDKNGHSVAVL